MKKKQFTTKYFIAGVVYLCSFIFIVGAAPAQPPQYPPTPQGLLSRLIEIKYNAELYLSAALQQTSHKITEHKEVYPNNEDEKSSALAIYNTLRWKVDALVYQLSGDMVAANSPRKMQLLNTWCLQQPGKVIHKKVPLGEKQITAFETLPAESLTSTTNIKKSIQNYAQSLIEIDNYYQTKIATPMYAANKTLNLTTNVFYLLKDSYTIIKGLSDLKTQKTMALIELLDHTRLLSPGEVEKLVK